MKEQQIIKSFNDGGTDDMSQQFARGVYYLSKEVGLSREEIFGHPTLIEVEVPAPRTSRLGRLIDALIGERTVKQTRFAKTPGMSAKGFMTYLKLMEEEAERQEHERKKNEMRNSLRGLGGRS